MKLTLFVVALVFSLCSQAQAPAPSEPVALAAEPHHTLLKENSYIRAFHFQLNPQDSTLTHRHDLDYVSVTLGPADFINAVTGKAEARVQQKDAEVHFTRGGFAHQVRDEGATPFRNFTLELLRPQGQARNLCRKIVAGDLGSCDPERTAPHDGVTRIAYFETDEMIAEVVELGAGKKYVDSNPTFDSLVAVLGDSSMRVEAPKVRPATLESGEITWLPRAATRTYTNLQSSPSRFLLLSFRDAGVSQ
jgi:hypothetical protein